MQFYYWYDESLKLTLANFRICATAMNAAKAKEKVVGDIDVLGINDGDKMTTTWVE